MKQIILFFVTLLSKGVLSAYTSESLANLYDSKSRGKFEVFDPDFKITQNTVNSIKSVMTQNFTDFTNIFIVIHSVDRSYMNKYTQKIDIVRFSEEFIFKILPKAERDRSIFVIFSLFDRVFRIRTGEKAREYLTDTMVTRASDMVKSYLADYQFDTAFVELYNLFVYEIGGGSTSGKYIIFAVVLSLVGLCIWSGHRETQKEKKVQELAKKLKTLEQMKALDTNFKEFRQENCTICLEAFEKDSETVQITPPQPLTQPGATPFSNAQSTPLTEPLTEQTAPTKNVYLDCGHNFHQACIADWLKTKAECPLCRVQVGDSHTTSSAAFLLQPVMFDAWRVHYRPYIDHNEFDEIARNPTNPNQWSWNMYIEQNNNYAPSYNYDSTAGGTAGQW